MPEITLAPEDMTVFAKCKVCHPAKPGTKVGRYFGKAYSRRKWDRGPKCDNCGTPMTFLHEVRA